MDVLPTSSTSCQWSVSSCQHYDEQQTKSNFHHPLMYSFTLHDFHSSKFRFCHKSTAATSHFGSEKTHVRLAYILYNNNIDVVCKVHTRLLCVLGGVFNILPFIFLQATLNYFPLNPFPLNPFPLNPF